jgi:hypothetical protein
MHTLLVAILGLVAIASLTTVGPFIKTPKTLCPCRLRKIAGGYDHDLKHTCHEGFCLVEDSTGAYSFLSVVGDRRLRVSPTQFQAVTRVLTLRSKLSHLSIAISIHKGLGSI